MQTVHSMIVRSLHKTGSAFLVAGVLVALPTLGCGGPGAGEPPATSAADTGTPGAPRETFTPAELAKMENMEPDEVAEYKKARLAKYAKPSAKGSKKK